MKRILFLASLVGAVAVGGTSSFAFDNIYQTARVSSEELAAFPNGAPAPADPTQFGADVDFEGVEAEEEEGNRLLSGSMTGTWIDGFGREGHAANLDEIWLTSEHVVDPNKAGLDLGYRVDALFGVNNMQSSDGFDGRWGVSGDGYAASIYQAYGQLGFGKLSMKAGKFGTPIGYEAVDGSENSFNTHSYLYNHEPATHTGGIFTFQPSDAFSVDVGLTSGADNSFENRRGDTGFLFGVNWDLAETLSVCYASQLNQIHSRLGEDRATTSYGYYEELLGRSIGDHDEYLQSVTLDWALTDKLSYAVAVDYGCLADRAEDLSRYGLFGVANYLTYSVTDKLDYVMRYEYFTQWLDDAGKQLGYAGEMRQNIHDASVGFVYRPMEHLFIRPEARYDWLETGDTKAKLTVKESGFTGAVGCGFTF